MTTKVASNDQKMKKNKKEKEHDDEWTRFLMFSVSIIIMFIAVMMVVVGLTVYSHYHNFKFFYLSLKSGHLIAPSLLCVCLSYAAFLSLILILKLVVVILTLTANGEKIVDIIYIPVSEYAIEPEIQLELDYMQNKLNCCGSDSHLDYIGVEFTSNHSTVVVSERDSYGELVNMVVPSSCCAVMGDGVCSSMWSTGCKDALLNALALYTTLFTVVGGSLMIIDLLGIVLALILARSIRRQKNHSIMLQWKKKEQTIMARETEGQTNAEQIHEVVK